MKNWKLYIWRVLEGVGIIAAIVGLVLQYQSLQEQKILGAWQLITTEAKGNSGKIEALEFLNSKGVPLVGVDLSKAYLGGVNLKGANLQGANFTEADLSDANFEGADLQNTKFNGAVLKKAIFANAMLEFANFKGANLTDANFASATVESTIFKDSWIQTIESQRSSPSATVTFSPVRTSKDGKIFIELIKTKNLTT